MNWDKAEIVNEQGESFCTDSSDSFASVQQIFLHFMLTGLLKDGKLVM
jgi:hypothetical protein